MKNIKDDFVVVRVTKGMKKQLQKKAEYYGRTLSDYLTRQFSKIIGK